MAFFKQHPKLSALFILCVLGFVAQIVMIMMSRSEIEASEKKYKRQLRERETILALSPAPTQQNLELTEANIRELHDQLQRLEASINEGTQADFAMDIPRTSSDMLFEIQAMIQGFHNEATKEVITDKATGSERPLIRIDEKFNFGFSEFIEAGRGPENEYIQRVHIQRKVIEFLLFKLFEAKPDSIIDLQRDHVTVPSETQTPVANTGRGRSTVPAASQPPKGTFVIPPLVSARIPGVIQTYAFKIVFTGYTESLRNFLTSLQEFEGRPLVVRSVEVKPTASATAAKPAATKNDASSIFALFDPGGNQPANTQAVEVAARTPVVENNLSEFTVILELIEVAPMAVANKEAGVTQ